MTNTKWKEEKKKKRPKKDTGPNSQLTWVGAAYTQLSWIGPAVIQLTIDYFLENNEI